MRLTSSLKLTVEVMPGTNVDEAARDLVSLANQVGRQVDARFNDLPLYADPGESASVVSDRWWRLHLERKRVQGRCPACGRPGLAAGKTAERPALPATAADDRPPRWLPW